MRVTFKMIQKVFEDNGYKIEKMKKTKHYSVTKGDANHHIYVNKPLKDFYPELNEMGIIEFMLKYKMTEKTKTKKKNGKTKEVRELEKRRIKTTLKIMNMNMKRGSTEHLALREELHNIVDKLKELGVYGGKPISREEVARMIEKRKKRKKNKTKKNTTIKR